jgi:hypothetical protein
VTATHCKWGHPWDGNTYVSPSGVRQCRACRRWAQGNYRRANRQPRRPAAPLLALQGAVPDGVFAERIGVARRTVLRWRARPDALVYPSTADKAATLLGLRIEDIWPEAA